MISFCPGGALRSTFASTRFSELRLSAMSRTGRTTYSYPAERLLICKSPRDGQASGFSSSPGLSSRGVPMIARFNRTTAPMDTSSDVHDWTSRTSVGLATRMMFSDMPSFASPEVSLQRSATAMTHTAMRPISKSSKRLSQHWRHMRAYCGRAEESSLSRFLAVALACHANDRMDTTPSTCGSKLMTGAAKAKQVSPFRETTNTAQTAIQALGRGVV